MEEFLYLGALLDKEGIATKDTQQRLSKARQTFYSNGRSNPEVVGSIPTEVKGILSLPRVVP